MTTVLAISGESKIETAEAALLRRASVRKQVYRESHALAAEVYAALDMPFAVLVGQIASALTKK